jgi:hypothetical protein
MTKPKPYEPRWFSKRRARKQRETQLAAIFQREDALGPSPRIAIVKTKQFMANNKAYHYYYSEGSTRAVCGGRGPGRVEQEQGGAVVSVLGS